jgi:hypothetical protein
MASASGDAGLGGEPAPLPRCPAARLPFRPDNRLAHQLVGSDADREWEPEPFTNLAPHPRGDVHRRPEEPAGAGEVEERVPVSSRLDHRRVDPKDLVQRTRGPGIEPGIGWDEHQIGAELPCLPHRHAPLDSRAPRLGRER